MLNVQPAVGLLQVVRREEPSVSRSLTDFSFSSSSLAQEAAADSSQRAHRHGHTQRPSPRSPLQQQKPAPTAVQTSGEGEARRLPVSGALSTHCRCLLKAGRTITPPPPEVELT